MKNILQKNQGGMLVAMVIIILTFIVTVGVLLIGFVMDEALITRGRSEDTMAFMAADAGIEWSLHELNDDDTYAGTGSEVTLADNSRYLITYQTTVVPGLYANSQKLITSTGRLFRKPDTTNPVSKRTVELEVQSGSINFEHTLQTGNGALYLYGNVGLTGDVFANYIISIQNTAVDLAGTISAAGQDANGCSIIGGTNNVSIEGSNIATRYEICNVDVSTSTVSENDPTVLPKPLPNIDRVETMAGITTTVPCSNVNNPTGLQPYAIVSGHYPDDGSDTVNGCDIILQNNKSYRLSGNIHVRGNFSGTNNTITTTGTEDVYVLVEGNIDISRVNVAGPVPVIFVSYSTVDSGGSQSDPNAIEISGNNLSLNAYFLAHDGSIGFGGSSATGSSIGAMAANSIVMKGSGTSVFLNIYPTSPNSNRVFRPIQYQRSFDHLN